MTIDEAVEDYVRFVGVRAKNTGRTYRNALNRFLEFLESQGLTSDDRASLLTMKHARDYAGWLAHDYKTTEGTSLSSAALDLYLTSVLRFYDHLITEDVIDSRNYVKTHKAIRRLVVREDVPIDKKLPPPEVVDAVLELAEEPPHLPDDMPLGECERQILAWVRNRAIIYCLYSSGARVSEIMKLRRGDLQYDDQGAWATKTKGHKTRFIRFSDAAWEYLMIYLKMRNDSGNLDRLPLFCRHDRGVGNQIKPLGVLSVERLIKRLLQDSGMADKFNLTPHSFRHFFATRFLRATGNLALTQDALGHADPNITRVYAKTTKGELIDAHSKLFENE